MIRLTASISSNTAGPALDSLLEQFEDQQALNKVATDAAEPIAVEARKNIRKKTGRTHDQITVWADPDAPVGTFAVFVGIPGPEDAGRTSRAWIGRLLEEGHRIEFGSSQRKAWPWLRPANDSEGGERLMKRFADLVRERLVRPAAR